MHDIERFRSGAGLPASLVTYFVNNSLNKNTNLVQCMEAVAEKVSLFIILVILIFLTVSQGYPRVCH